MLLASAELAQAAIYLVAHQPTTQNPYKDVMTKAVPSAPTHTVVPRIDGRIQVIRGPREMVDADLAQLYGVPTKALNQAVKRCAAWFPHDFMFQLNSAKKAEVVTNCDHLSKLKFSRALPFAFTEYGWGVGVGVGAGQCAGLRPGGRDGHVCGAGLCAAALGQQRACRFGQTAHRFGIDHRTARALA